MVLSRVTIDGQELLILVTDATLKGPQLLAQGAML
jgi:hypothetical protein